MNIYILFIGCIFCITLMWISILVVWDFIDVQNLQLSPTTSMVALVLGTTQAIQFFQGNSIALDLQLPTNVNSQVQQNKKLLMFFKEGNTTKFNVDDYFNLRATKFKENQLNPIILVDLPLNSLVVNDANVVLPSSTFISITITLHSRFTKKINVEAPRLSNQPP